MMQKDKSVDQSLNFHTFSNDKQISSSSNALDTFSSHENPTNGISHSPSTPLHLNTNPHPRLRSFSLDSCSQAGSILSLSVIQTVSEQEEIVDDSQLIHSKQTSADSHNNTPLPADSHDATLLPALPAIQEETSSYLSELTVNELACVASTPSPSPPPPPLEISALDTTPRSGFAIPSSTSANPYGTRIGKNHSSYLFMFHMLTGIKLAVQREEERSHDQEIKAPSPKAFKRRVKFAFDKSSGSFLPFCATSRKKIFKDYAPTAFRFLRKLFFINTDDYLSSLTGKYILSEKGSPGRSGSFFYYSHDYRFLIKTLSKAEYRCLLSILPDYCSHVEAYPNTLLTRFLGLHRISGVRDTKYFVIMGNVFPPSKDIHEIYDLKGSFYGRQVPVRRLTRCPREPRKDLNWLRSGRKLLLSSRKSSLLIFQLEKDVEFLQNHNIMDYSLLVGIHSIQRGNRERIRDKALSVFETVTIEESERSRSHHHRRSKPRRSSLRSAIVGFARPLTQEDPVALMEQSHPVDETPSHPSLTSIFSHALAERSHFIFYSEEGGLFSGTEECLTDVSTTGDKPTEIYYLGIIDILTPYSFKKQIEHIVKSCCSKDLSISAVSPQMYSKRFLAFLRRCLLNIHGPVAAGRSRDSNRIEKYLTSMVTQSEYELSLASSMVGAARTRPSAVEVTAT